MELTKKEIELLQRVADLFVHYSSSENVELIYRTPAQSLRHQADMIEARDSVAKEFRDLLDKLKKA